MDVIDYLIADLDYSLSYYITDKEALDIIRAKISDIREHIKEEEDSFYFDIFPEEEDSSETIEVF